MQFTHLKDLFTTLLFETCPENREIKIIRWLCSGRKMQIGTAHCIQKPEDVHFYWSNFAAADIRQHEHFKDGASNPFLYRIKQDMHRIGQAERQSCLLRQRCVNSAHCNSYLARRKLAFCFIPHESLSVRIIWRQGDCTSSESK